LPSKVRSAESCRPSFDAIRVQPEAQAYFDEHAEDGDLLRTVFEIVMTDASDGVRLLACYYISRFSGRLLEEYEDELLLLQADAWESLAELQAWPPGGRCRWLRYGVLQRVQGRQSVRGRSGYSGIGQKFSDVPRLIKFIGDTYLS
jgi:hypothetical protein